MSKWKKVRHGVYQLGKAAVYEDALVGWFLTYELSQLGCYRDADSAMSAGERMVARFETPRKRAKSP